MWDALVTVRYEGQTVLTIRGDAASDLKSRLQSSASDGSIMLADIDNDMTPELLIRTRVDYSNNTESIVHVLSQTGKQAVLAKVRITWPMEKADWLTDPDENHVFQLNTLSGKGGPTALAWVKDRFAPVVAATK